MSRRKLKPAPPPTPEIVQPGRAVHTLVANPARQRWPRRLVFWALEVDEPEPGQPFRFICASARLYLRQPDYTYLEADGGICHHPAELWNAIDAWTRRKDAMRLYNPDLVRHLGWARWADNLWERLGYRGQPGKDIQFAKSGNAPYLRLRRGERAQLTFIDTQTLHIGTPHQLGIDLGMPAQPGEPDERCMWTSHALAGGVLRYLEHFRELGVRPSGLTGPGNGFDILRTRHLEPGSIIHQPPDDPIWEAETESRYDGRREGWRHGVVDQELEDWDYQYAHLAICLKPLPSKPIVSSWAPTARNEVSLQEWLVDTPVPCVPYYKPDGKPEVIYPVGRFPATLWGPEAAMAMDAGAKLEPAGKRWVYELVPCMQSFAEWCISELDNSPDPIWRRCVKSWSHTTVGKWAQAMAAYEAVDARWPDEWRLGAFAVASCSGDTPYNRMLYSDVGVWGIRDEVQPAEHANFAIHSYVVSQTRIRLWRAMMAAGLDEVVHVNGDGLVVTKLGGRRLRRAGLEGLRHKGTYKLGVEIANAQAIIDRDPSSPSHKIAGLARGAEQIGPHRWVAETWNAGLLVEPTRSRSVWDLPPGPLGRIRAEGGATRPYKVAAW